MFAAGHELQVASKARVLSRLHLLFVGAQAILALALLGLADGPFSLSSKLRITAVGLLLLLPTVATLLLNLIIAVMKLFLPLHHDLLPLRVSEHM